MAVIRTTDRHVSTSKHASPAALRSLTLAIDACSCLTDSQWGRLRAACSTGCIASTRGAAFCDKVTGSCSNCTTGYGLTTATAGRLATCSGATLLTALVEQCSIVYSAQTLPFSAIFRQHCRPTPCCSARNCRCGQQLRCPVGIIVSTTQRQRLSILTFSVAGALQSLGCLKSSNQTSYCVSPCGTCLRKQTSGHIITCVILAACNSNNAVYTASNTCTACPPNSTLNADGTSCGTAVKRHHHLGDATLLGSALAASRRWLLRSSYQQQIDDVSLVGND